jgi:Membrane proteins related to metalloendopeptidases
MSVLWPNGTLKIPIVSSEFGMRINPFSGLRAMHEGIDLIGWSYIQAPVAGIVSFAGYNGAAGNEVRIKADNGDVFRLLHNRTLLVRTGQRVAQGQRVSIMGTTGASTGVHCHEETRPGGGVAINPRTYYANKNIGPAGGKEEEVVNFFRAIDTRKRTLKKGVWQNLYINDKNAVSFATGECIVQSTAIVNLRGLPAGTEVQFRLVRTKAGTEDVRGGTGAREAVATPGTTFAVMSDSFELTERDDGLRWQYAVQHDGVQVVRTEITAIIHS